MMRTVIFAFLMLFGCSNSTTKQEYVFTRRSNELIDDKSFYIFQQNCIRIIERTDVRKVAKRMDWMKSLYSEGEECLSLDWKHLKQKYGTRLSKAYNSWLDHLSKTEQIVEDAVIRVPPDKLREYIIYLENFIERNKDFVAITDVIDTLEWYLYIYLNGTDNTPIYDRETGRMGKEFRESYGKFLTYNQKSKYYRLVRLRVNSKSRFQRIIPRVKSIEKKQHTDLKTII